MTVLFHLFLRKSSLFIVRKPFCGFTEVYIFAVRKAELFCFINAGVAQLVERHLAKVEVAGSSLVSRSESKNSVLITLNIEFTL